jgi:hypothetical protein
MNLEELIAGSRPFLAWLVDWYNSRPILPLDELLEGVDNEPDRLAVLAVDVTVGFCSDGALASERVGGIVKPIARLFQRVHDAICSRSSRRTRSSLTLAPNWTLGSRPILRSRPSSSSVT